MFCLLNQSEEWINTSFRAVITRKEKYDTQNPVLGTMNNSEFMEDNPNLCNLPSDWVSKMPIRTTEE